MTWLAQHWAALLGWLAAIGAAAWGAIKIWRLNRQVTVARREELVAKAERDDAKLKARDAEIEAHAVREQAKALGLLDLEAKHDRASGGSLAGDIAKLNRDANGSGDPGGGR